VAIDNPLMQQLRIKHPVIQAPMAGGADTPELVAAVCNAGALGFIGAGYSTPEQIAELAKSVRGQTKHPFGLNLFAQTPAPEAPRNVDAVLQGVAPFFAELGLPAPTAPAMPSITFSEQLAAVLETDSSFFSFTFGIPSTGPIQALKRRGIFVLGTATTVDEAVELEKAGVDAIVAEGSEAGGHRGTFSGDFTAGLVGTISLVPQIVDAVRIPVIASGGIMDGRGIAAALALGASAVQMGTAFLTCKESGVPESYKEAILTSPESETRITRAFSGRPARGIINRFLTTFESDEAAQSILPFPLQNALTRPLRNAARNQNRAEFLSLWAGQGVRLARRQSAAELISRLALETDAAIAKLQSGGQKQPAHAGSRA